MTGASFNIYCDESCHLEHDGQPIMVLGALMMPAERVRDVAEAIRAVKERHGLPRALEIKWSKVSPGGYEFYTDLVDLFFDDPDLSFRSLVVPDKSKLDHVRHAQTHDTFYYKMYFELLKVLLHRGDQYSVYLDIKDTNSAARVARLSTILSNNMGDFERETIRRIQHVRSHEVEQVQLADLLIGAVSYANRGLHANAAKRSLVEQVRARSGARLTQSTWKGARKVNIFHWASREELGL